MKMSKFHLSSRQNNASIFCSTSLPAKTMEFGIVTARYSSFTVGRYLANVNVRRTDTRRRTPTLLNV